MPPWTEKRLWRPSRAQTGFCALLFAAAPVAFFFFFSRRPAPRPRPAATKPRHRAREALVRRRVVHVLLLQPTEPAGGRCGEIRHGLVRRRLGRRRLSS